MAPQLLSQLQGSKGFRHPVSKGFRSRAKYKRKSTSFRNTTLNAHYHGNGIDNRVSVLDVANSCKSILCYVLQNDIIGPSGFGDANFIPANIVLEYKIRFENDANATAPAQRVFIRHQLDDDVDERSFRVGSFGFGDFTQNISMRRAFLQV